MKHYIGLQVDGQSNNFLIFRPQKKSLLLWIRAKKNDEFDALLDGSELDLLEYDKSGRYRVRLAPNDIAENEDLLRNVFKRAYDEATGKA